MRYEENPFEDPKGAEEWIEAVEHEHGTIRDKEIHPLLSLWTRSARPRKVLEIGCGQGICSDKLGDPSIDYVGVDPSATLISRARKLYESVKRRFVIGNAYELPFDNESFEACFSVTVWFHLQDIKRASVEMARVLRGDGSYLIITPDPDSYDVWESHYTDVIRDGKKIVGKAAILLNPGEPEPRYAYLSRNTFYLHTKAEILDAFTQAGLFVDRVDKMGYLPRDNGRNLFLCITGHKPRV